MVVCGCYFFLLGVGGLSAAHTPTHKLCTIIFYHLAEIGNTVDKDKEQNEGNESNENVQSSQTGN